MPNMESTPVHSQNPEDQVIEPLKEFADIAGDVGLVISIVGVVITVAGFIMLNSDPETKAAIVEFFRSILSTNFPLVGLAVGIATWFAGAVIIHMFKEDRCKEQDGDPECVAGLIVGIVHGFNDVADELFPFTATHDRADLLAKSEYWDIIERYNAYVYYTEHEEFSQRSELLRCYFYSEKTCSAAVGADVGGNIGGAVGTVLDIFIAAAIGGCSTIILCVLALVCLVIVAAVCVLAGAFIGGQIGKETVQNKDLSGAAPEGNILPLSVGDYASIRGNLVKRTYDNNANVFWWVSIDEETGELDVNLSGRAPASIQQNPFYADVDEDFLDDSCS